jgi:hypothetical protein
MVETDVTAVELRDWLVRFARPGIKHGWRCGEAGAARNAVLVIVALQRRGVPPRPWR